MKLFKVEIVAIYSITLGPLFELKFPECYVIAQNKKEAHQKVKEWLKSQDPEISTEASEYDLIEIAKDQASKNLNFGRLL